MSEDIFQGKWSQLQENFHLHFAKLSADDVIAIAGDGDQLASILHARYGYSDEQSQDAWDRFMRKYGRG